MNVPLRGLGSQSDASYDALFAEFAAQGVSPAEFQTARPGRSLPDPAICLKIQCGAITQAEAGIDTLADCSLAGYAGVKTCQDPLCWPYCTPTSATVARASQPLPVAQRVAARFLAGPVRGCDPIYSGPHFGGPYGDPKPCGCAAADFVNEHPLIAVGLLALAGWAVWTVREPRG